MFPGNGRWQLYTPSPKYHLLLTFWLQTNFCFTHFMQNSWADSCTSVYIISLSPLSTLLTNTIWPVYISTMWFNYCCPHSILHTITSMLANNKYVMVYAVDFSKAFDTVRHSTLFHKYANIDLPNFIYNWLECFFRIHSHCTLFENQLSDLLDISASIVQGSVIGPAS